MGKKKRSERIEAGHKAEEGHKQKRPYPSWLDMPGMVGGVVLAAVRLHSAEDFAVS